MSIFFFFFFFFYVFIPGCWPCLCFSWFFPQPKKEVVSNLADFDVKASLLNKSEQKLKSSNLHVGLDVHAALTRGCRLTKPQINAEGLHFSALVHVDCSQ